MLLMKESVLNVEEKTTQPWFTYFQIVSSEVLNSCLYLPQGQHGIHKVQLNM